MKEKNGTNKKGIIFWVGFGLGSVLAILAAWYVVTSYSKFHDATFAAYAMIPTFLILFALVFTIISRKVGACIFAGLFALFLATAIAQGPYLILYIIPAWLFMTSVLLFVSLYEK